jgi:hypothetical protein
VMLNSALIKQLIKLIVCQIAGLPSGINIRANHIGLPPRLKKGL